MEKSSRRMVLAYQQAPWRVQMQMIGAFLLGLVLLGVVAGVYLNVTARASKVGREIQTLQSKILTIQRENADLETQLAALTSASAMESRALAMGFRSITPGEAKYIKVSGYSGRQEIVLAPPPRMITTETEELPPEFTQTLFDWIRDFTLGAPIGIIQEVH